MCEAAALFTNRAKQMQDLCLKGIGSTIRPVNGITMFAFNPNWNAWLRTFEELGLPIVHPILASPSNNMACILGPEWFPYCAAKQDFSECNAESLCSVDFLLLDSRTYGVAQNPDVLTVFPDKTIQAGHFVSLLMNNTARSYKLITPVLNKLTQDLAGFISLYSKTSCTAVDPTSHEHTTVVLGGLAGGQYICYKEALIQTQYTTCPTVAFTPCFSDNMMVDVKNKGPTQVKTSRLTITFDLVWMVLTLECTVLGTPTKLREPILFSLQQISPFRLHLNFPMAIWSFVCKDSKAYQLVSSRSTTS